MSWSVCNNRQATRWALEGCDSGRLSSGNNSYLFKKDTNRFETDDVYKQGWNDGFNRCVSGEGAPTVTNTYYQSSYGYAPGTFSYGFYYPSYYYAPGFSIWSGYYVNPRPRYVYRHRHNHYYTPWYGGRKHRGHRHRGYRGKPYVAKSWTGPNRGGGFKSGGGKSRGSRGGGGRSPGAWIR